jgi:hypothetical protein
LDISRACPLIRQQRERSDRRDTETQRPQRREAPRGPDGQGGPGLSDKLETQRRAAHGPERVAATGAGKAGRVEPRTSAQGGLGAVPGA